MDAGDRAASRPDNLFGFLRLLFAFLVVLAHSPELLDGDNSRELLWRLFHSLSFGELGVDGFFLLSGYLILQSWLRSAGSGQYLWKRLLRIVPGFVVAFFVGWLVVVPLAGGHITHEGRVPQLLRLLALDEPAAGDAFVGLPYPLVNGAMWTIAYEFRCYLLVMVLGWLGLFRHPRVYGLLWVGLALLYGLDLDWKTLLPWRNLGEHMDSHLRFTMIFLAGGGFHLLRGAIPYRPIYLVAAAVALIATMFGRVSFAHIGVALFGGYLMFWFARAVKLPVLARVGGRVDISYGMYLYAWPVQNLLIQRHPDMSPWLLTAIAAPVAGAFGYASWRLVEAPFLRLKGRG